MPVQTSSMACLRMTRPPVVVIRYLRQSCAPDPVPCRCRSAHIVNSVLDGVAANAQTVRSGLLDRRDHGGPKFVRRLRNADRARWDLVLPRLADWPSGSGQAVRKRAQARTRRALLAGDP